MEGLGSAFSGLPYFSPMMMVNRSETCATRKLLQCRGFGTYENDISDKYRRGPENSPDLSPEGFMARKSIISQVKALKTPSVEWIPILSTYEIVKGSAKRERDWGHLLFISTTTTYYLLVMIFPDECDCGNLSHHDYAALTKFHANKFLCLTKYIWHDEQPPKWIRATYVTPKTGYTIDPILATVQHGSENDGAANLAPPMLHINVKDATPSLSSSELERINAVMSQDRQEPPPDSVRLTVLGDDRPDVSDAWKAKNIRACGYCEVFPSATKKLMTCSRCKLVQYCGPQCQKAAWPSHKHFCKKK